MPGPIRSRPHPRRFLATLDRPHDQDGLVASAIAYLAELLARPGESLKTPAALHDYLRLQLADEVNEVFCAAFLDLHHRLIAFEILARGGPSTVPVYPREVVRRCLHHNATAVVVAHNHPTGVVRPSEADKEVNRKVREACDLFDIRLIDSLIIGGDCRMEIYSAAKCGWK